MAMRKTCCAPPPTAKALLKNKGSGMFPIMSAMGVKYPAVSALANTTAMRREVVAIRCRQVSPVDGTLLSKMIATSAPEKPASNTSGRRPSGTPKAIRDGTVAVAATMVTVADVVGSTI